MALVRVRPVQDLLEISTSVWRHEIGQWNVGSVHADPVVRLDGYVSMTHQDLADVVNAVVQMCTIPTLAGFRVVPVVVFGIDRLPKLVLESVSMCSLIADLFHNSLPNSAAGGALRGLHNSHLPRGQFRRRFVPACSCRPRIK